ncbi:MAG: hypothetical protein GF355_17305 [Candidatus Eisenbacteria bacterium]|nr:hypothetical protein [Candidatus Eisenbacteria bacterium]
MHFLDDPVTMSPVARLREVAAILATGVIRLRTRQLATPKEPSNSFSHKELDVSGRPSPPVTDGLTDRDPVREEASR